MTVTLDANGIRALAGNAAAVAAFPFLSKYAPRSSGCCGGGSSAPDTARAARTLLSLPPARKAVLRSLLGADTVVVTVVRAARVVKERL